MIERYFIMLYFIIKILFCTSIKTQPCNINSYKLHLYSYNLFFKFFSNLQILILFEYFILF